MHAFRGWIFGGCPFYTNITCPRFYSSTVCFKKMMALLFLKRVLNKITINHMNFFFINHEENDICEFYLYVGLSVFKIVMTKCS